MYNIFLYVSHQTHFIQKYVNIHKMSVLVFFNLSEIIQIQRTEKQTTIYLHSLPSKTPIIIAKIY